MEEVVVKRFREGASPWQVLADSATTGGDFLIGEAHLDPGAPTPGLHRHEHEHEAMYVIEGLLTVEVGEQRMELGPGDSLVMPPRIPHRFGNLSDQPVWALGVVAPTDIEQMFAEEEAYFSQLDGPPDPERIAEICAPYGVTFLGPPLTE